MLSINATFVGKVLLEFDELPSTNDYARHIANEPQIPEGAVVKTACQTAGRGQLGAVWESAPGDNLTLSIIFKPNWLRADRQFGLSKAVALAVYDTVNEALSHLLPNYTLQIKWPNDLLLNEKKIAGILIENTISGQHLGIAVVGIGLNINQTRFSAALPNAGSLALATGAITDPITVQQRLFYFLEKRYLQLRDHPIATLDQDYLDHLYGYQQYLAYETLPDQQLFYGTITGVTESGLLVFATEQGERVFGLKEVRWVK